MMGQLGAMSQITGKKLPDVHTELSLLGGSPHVFAFDLGE
jgi:hypothetical protein